MTKKKESKIKELEQRITSLEYETSKCLSCGVKRKYHAATCG